MWTFELFRMRSTGSTYSYEIILHKFLWYMDASNAKISLESVTNQ